MNKYIRNFLLKNDFEFKSFDNGDTNYYGEYILVSSVEHFSINIMHTTYGWNIHVYNVQNNIGYNASKLEIISKQYLNTVFDACKISFRIPY